MNINATLLVQMLTFAAFIWFTMRFVWPPVMQALADRRDTIANGLAAAERGHRELALAQQRAKENLRDAKAEAAEILEQANRRAGNLIDQAKKDAQEEGKRLAKLARDEIVQELNQAKTALRKQYAGLVVAGAQKILAREIDVAANNTLLDKLIEEI